MSRIVFRNVAALAVLLAPCLTVGAVCNATEPKAARTAAPQPFVGVIVLQDGGTLSGSITRDGQRYIVATDDSEIIVADANIDYVCHSLLDAYDRKRAALVSPTVEARLEIAEWCLRHDLLTEALTELTEGRNLDARHPRLALLERRIAVAQEQRSAATTAAPEKPVDTPASMAPARASAALPNEPNRFDLLISDLPPGAVERFTRKVQPVLVNSCATAGCHQVGSSRSFQLDRSLLHDMANRRSTMQNLSATLALVDPAQPEQSPLLTVPRRAHGGMEKAVFGPRDDKLLLQLAAWVALVTEATNQTEKPIADANIAATSNEAEFGDRLAEAADDPASFEDAAALRPPARIRYGAVFRPIEPRDEFDPDVFNRRYSVGDAHVAESDAAGSDMAVSEQVPPAGGTR